MNASFPHNIHTNILFSSDTLHSEVILGDGTWLNAANPHPFRQCGKCAHMAPARPTAPPTPPPTTPREEELLTEIVDVKEVESKERWVLDTSEINNAPNGFSHMTTSEVSKTRIQIFPNLPLPRMKIKNNDE